MLDHLKNVRETAKMTTAEVAKSAGISKGYYSMIENGKRGLSYEMAVKIASVFEMKPDDIFLQSKSTNSSHSDFYMTKVSN